ncbi:AraC family transcriptional regulator [Paenibacillus sp. PAMC21692]|uniref:helix-turn-helix transcriptional regulator n=1 Tax=Paenibacillus sp. PAMC21692 TaxID=2762320 RepID=UPI0021C30522|nr:AraC family transcriptional regulator [Paenibacillus sp. PAMC21692]
MTSICTKMMWLAGLRSFRSELFLYDRGFHPMGILERKSQTQFLTHHACRTITLNDVVIEWIDILFEDSSGVSYCAPHSHDWYEFNYVVQGTMHTALEDGIMHRMDQGTFVLIPPGFVHSHRYEASSPHEGLCLRWRMFQRTADADTESKLDAIAIYDKLMRLTIGVTPPKTDEFGIGKYLETLLAQSEAGEQAIFLQMSFVRLLLRLTESLPAAALAFSPVKPTNRLVRKVDIFLGDLQDRELDVKSLAASLHHSYAHVAREFKRHTGRTIIERMTEIRLYKAEDLLKHTDLSIKEIADRAGFSSAFYFSRVFKSAYGISPTAYRKGCFSD